MESVNRQKQTSTFQILSQFSDHVEIISATVALAPPRRLEKQDNAVSQSLSVRRELYRKPGDEALKHALDATLRKSTTCFTRANCVNHLQGQRNHYTIFVSWIHMILSKILGGFFGDAVSRMGIRGVLKSMYYSRRHTGQVDMFLFDRNVLTEIDPKATFDITGRLAVSVLHVGASHPDLQKSKFSVTETGTVTVQAPGGNVSIGPGSVVHVEGDLSMGNSYVNSHARIICGDRISIGNGCSIAWNVQLIDDDRHALSIDGEQRPQKQSIEIQDNVWIGHDTTVKKGVTIGEGAVIGSNSVVTTDIPPHTLAVGSPAEVIANHVDWGFED